MTVPDWTFECRVRLHLGVTAASEQTFECNVGDRRHSREVQVSRVWSGCEHGLLGVNRCRMGAAGMVCKAAGVVCKTVEVVCKTVGSGSKKSHCCTKNLSNSTNHEEEEEEELLRRLFH